MSIDTADSIGVNNLRMISSFTRSWQLSKKLCIEDNAPPLPSKVTCYKNMFTGSHITWKKIRIYRFENRGCSFTVPATWMHLLVLFRTLILYSNEEMNFSRVKPFVEANFVQLSNLFIRNIRWIYLSKESTATEIGNYKTNPMSWWNQLKANQLVFYVMTNGYFD